MHRVVLPAIAIGMMMVSATAFVPAHARESAAQRAPVVIPPDQGKTQNTAPQRLRKPVLTAPLLEGVPPLSQNSVKLSNMPAPKPRDIGAKKTRPAAPAAPETVGIVNATPPGAFPAQDKPSAATQNTARPGLVVMEQDTDGPIQSFKVSGSVKPMYRVTHTTRSKQSGRILERDSSDPNVPDVKRARPAPRASTVTDPNAPTQVDWNRAQKAAQSQASKEAGLLAMMAPQSAPPVAVAPSEAIKRKQATQRRAARPTLVTMDTPPEPEFTQKKDAPARRQAEKSAKPSLIQVSSPVTKPAPQPTAAPQRQVVTFSGDSSELSDGGRKALEQAAQLMTRDPSLRLQLLAYAGGVDGSRGSARSMSLARALAVRSYLMGRGIRSTRVEVRALGAQTNTTPIDRVDLVYIK